MIQETTKGVWVLLATALLFNVLLVSLSTQEAAQTGFLRTLILDVLTPAEEFVDGTIDGVGSIWNNYFWLVNTRSENQRLRGEVSALRMEIARNRESLLEAARLREFLDLEPVMVGQPLIARVIGADTSFSRKHVRIDKGSADGLGTGTPVMTPDGVVGRVIYAGHFSAIVQLVSDPQSALGVIVRSSRLQGIVRGTGSADLELEYRGDPADLTAGEELITSGTDQIYPKGLPVGVIVSMGDVRDLINIGRIAPSADLGKLEEVLCLLSRGDRTELENAPVPDPVALP